jgi:hypothetical protein
LIAFGSSLITITVDWASLKTQIAAIKTPYHYNDDADLYSIFIIDMNVVYTTQIHKGIIPLSCSITQEQNDADKADFEDNYKDGANVPLSSVGISTTSTSPRNDHEMIKDGIVHKHINSALHLIDPDFIDFQFPVEHTKQYLWGCSSHVKDFGEDDYIVMQIVDKDNILGYGENTILKEYDQVWCQTLAKATSPFFTPDGAPGEIIGGLYARAVYYATDVTKIDVKIWLDYILTIKT